MSGDDAAFPAFFDRHHVELSRLAYLLTGDASVADDLAADALGQVRRVWPRVGGDDPAGYARGLVATLARRSASRRLFGAGRRETVDLREAAGRGGAVERVEAAGRREAVDLRGALRRLPHRRRVCVVMRYAFGLTEAEVAQALGISPAAARSRTAKGVRQLEALLGGTLEVTRLGGWEAAR